MPVPCSAKLGFTTSLRSRIKRLSRFVRLYRITSFQDLSNLRCVFILPFLIHPAQVVDVGVNRCKCTQILNSTIFHVQLP